MDDEEFEPRVATLKQGQIDEFYDIKEQLGKGRYGTVYRCIEKETGHEWAAKYIRAVKSTDKEAARKEVEVMNQIKHPKLLQCVDAFEMSNRIVMVMEYISGGELFERVIDDDFDLTEKEVILYMRQICEGVEHMHKRSYLHLDLKPENIMCVDKVGTRIKLIDFGMARKLDPDEAVKVMFGTPEFVAPEVVNYESIGFPTDMWSLGVICYVLLSGLSPFMGDTDAETLTNVTLGEWDFEDEAFDDVSDDAKDFIARLLVKNKDSRRTITQCLEHPWLARKTLSNRQSFRLRGASVRLKRYMARRRWQKTATAVRAIGRMTALRLFSNHKKSTGQDPLVGSAGSTSLADLLKAKREEDAQRETKDTEDPKPAANGGEESVIDLNDRVEPVSKPVTQVDTPEIYHVEDSAVPPRRVIDTGIISKQVDNNTDGFTSPSTNTSVGGSSTITDGEAPFSNYGSDLTSSDRTSDFAEYDRTSDLGLADFNSHTSDSEDMDIDTDNPAKDVTEAATAIQAVFRGHRARKRTYQPPAILEDIRDCDVFEGSAARFDCRISGFPEPQVYWYKDGKEIKEDRHYRIEFDEVDLCSLIIREAEADDDGLYKCEARNAAGTAFSEAELLVEVLDEASDAEDEKATSEKSIGERVTSEGRVTPEPTQNLPSDNTAWKNVDQHKPEEVTLTNHFEVSAAAKETTSSSRSDFDSGGEKSSSDWTPRSSPCTSAGVSPSSSLLELDSWHKRGRITSTDTQPIKNTAGSPGRLSERISRYDDRNKGPKQNVNSIGYNSPPLGVHTRGSSSPGNSAVSGTSDKPSYVTQAAAERPSRSRIAELESKRKPVRSSSEPPPEFQNKRELILNRASKFEQSKNYSSYKGSSNNKTREVYESSYSKLLKNSRTPSGVGGSNTRPLKPQFATKISVFSGTGSNGKPDGQSNIEPKQDRKFYGGREIKVKSLPKVVVSREASILKARPIESIRVKHDKTNGRLSSDDSLTDNEKSTASSGNHEVKKTYLTEKTFELIGDRALNSRQPGSVLAWKIEKFAKGTPLKSHTAVEDEPRVTSRQTTRTWNPNNDKSHRRAQSVDRALYPGQGANSLASKIQKFSKNQSSQESNKVKLKTYEFKSSSVRYEMQRGKSVDVNNSRKPERSPERQVSLKVKTTSIETGDETSDKVPGDKGVKIEKTTERVVSSQRATESVLNSTKDKTDIPIPAGSRHIEKAIEVTKASVVCSPPSANDRQIATEEKSNSDRSYSSSVKTSEVDGSVKSSSSNDLFIEASAVTSSVSTITKTTPGGEPKETTAAAKPKASAAAMNRRGVTPGGIGKLTARFESNKPEPAKSSTVRREPFIRSSLSDKKQLFDGSAAKPKTNGNSSLNYRDILKPASKTKNATALDAGKPLADKNTSSGRLGATPSPLSSRYQVKPSVDEKAPSFIQRPRDQTGVQGGSLYFAVSVEGTPTPDISWHYKGKSLKDEGRCEIYTEKDVHFLEIFELEPSDAGIYTCRLVNKAGRVSAMAELKVTEKPKPAVMSGQAPSFITRISDCELCDGEEALFECKVSGDPFPEITWIMDGKLVQEGPRHRFVCKSDGTCALIVTDVTADDDAVYTCTAKNALGMVSSTAELIVEFEDIPKPEEPKIEIKTQISTAKVQPKEPLLRDELRSESKEETRKVQPSSEVSKENNKTGSTTTDEPHSIVKTQQDEVFSEAPLNYQHQPRRSSLQSTGMPVPKPPEFILRPRSHHITPPETARLSCMVKGYPTPSVTWKKNTMVLKDEGRFEIFKDGGEEILEIYDTVEEDAGRYTCVLANEHGKTTSSANIALRGKITRDIPPKFTQRMTHSRTKDGGTARFSCRVTGEPAPTIQWLFLGKEISPDDDIYEIAFDGEKATLVLPEVLPEDEGEYECIARNRDGEVSCRARLSVEIALTEPSESVEPVATVAPAGQVQQLKKKGPWELERKTSRTEIFLQASAPEASSDSEDESSSALSKRDEKVLSAKKDLTSKQDVVVEKSPKYKVEVVENQEEKSKPYGFHNKESDVSVVFKAKLPKDRVEITPEKRSFEPKTIAVEPTKKETLPSLELKLDLESESESEPEQSVGKVEPVQVKQEEPESENLVSTTSDVSETEPEADIVPEIVASDGEIVASDPEIVTSDPESVNQEPPTDNGAIELVISDVEPELEVKIETKELEEASPPVAVTQSKPEFLQTPSDVEVIDGSPLALTVKVKGTPAPDVMWIFDNCEILEDDDFKLLHDGELHSLVIREVYPEDAGIYYCKAFNTAGEEQCAAKIDVKDPVCQGSPPKFTQKPRSLTVDEGSSLKLTCKVEGDPEPAISWSKDGRIISPGQRIVLKKLGLHIRILQIPTALSTDAGSYTCVIANANGEEKCTVSVVVHPLDEEQTDFRQLLKSRPRLQNINNNNTFNSSTDKSSPESDPTQLDFRHVLTRHVQTKTSPKFTEGLKDMRIKEGETAVFHCQVEGVPQPTVAWTVDGREIKESKYFKMTNEGTLAKLTITEAFPEDEGEYSCIASNTAGQEKTTSDLKIVPWEDDDDVDFAKPGEKRDNMDEVFKRSLTISEDDDADIDIPASGTPAITVTEASPKKVKKIPPPVPAKKISLERARAPSFDHAENNQNSETVSRGTTLPQFVVGLSDKRITQGSATVLECEITGEPEPDIVWYREGEEIKEGGKYRYEFEGDHGVLLVINNATMSDCGQYTCKAVNPVGSAESSAQLISGGVPAKIESGPKSIEVISGQTARISCEIAGSPNPEVTWSKYRKEVEESDRKQMDATESSATLTIRKASEEDAGRYTINVCNALGTDSFEISVSVVDKPDPPSGNPTASDVTSTSLTLSWSVVSYDGGSRIIGYVIEMCRADDDNKWQPLTSTTHTSHVITDLQPEVEYVFRVSAENVHGISEPSQVSDPVLTVDEAPRVKEEKHSGESDDDSDEFIVHGDVTIRTDKEVGDLYNIKEQVGKGRFGVVYRCIEKATGKTFAAKFIKTKPSDRESVRSEIRIMNELHHPKLLQCVDAFEVPKQIIMVMEFIAGGELFERVIDDDFVLTEKDAIKFMRQICAGVHYMHDQNILHLDLKPENVMCVDTHGCRIKLIDFGLARKFDPTKNTKVMFGTPEFVAPEVINYELIGYATDLWSIGVICYILLSGLSPFMGDNDAETLSNVTLAEWDFDDEAFDDISEESKDFIEKLLIKRKEKRMEVTECLQHTWLNKDIKTMKATQLSTAKLKKFVARRRWQKTTTAVRAIGRMASLTMFAGLKKSGDQAGAAMRPGSPTQNLLKTALRKEAEDTKKTSRVLHLEEDENNGDCDAKRKNDALPVRTDANGGSAHPDKTLSGAKQTIDDVRKGVSRDRGIAERLKDSSDSEEELPGDREEKSQSAVNGFVNQDKVDSESSSSRMQADDSPDVARRSFPPKFSKDIIDAMVFEGDCARFDCHIEGEPEPEITWYQDDEELDESSRFLMEFDSDGVCSLIIKNVIEDDDAEYMVKAVNTAGEASSVAELIVHVPGAQ
ncbi:protein Obscurin-like isoform X2 [Asterias amurensis]|uniref:protein Obscurin-like isoform X2 n=1 Tax=Asterias amurensis TaxID=7602 RepID=UPI003AB2CCC3